MLEQSQDTRKTSFWGISTCFIDEIDLHIDKQVELMEN